jgi:hypothetical protein
MTLKIKGTNVGSMKVRGSGGGAIVKGVAPPLVTTGLVLHLDAGDPTSYPGSGTSWYDLSGNSNTSTLVNGVSYDSDSGGRMIFDGGDDYSSTGMSGFPGGTSPGSLWAWAKTTSTAPGWRMIIAYGYPGAGWVRFIGLNGASFGAGGYYDDVISTSATTSNVWFNICCTFDGSSARIYANGAPVTLSTPVSWNTYTGGGSSCDIGRQILSGGQHWAGSISQVLVYNVALSEAQVSQNFEATRSRYGL